MQLSDLPLMLTVDEAADVLRIGRNLMYEAVSAGTVASVRIGRTIRIPTGARRTSGWELAGWNRNPQQTGWVDLLRGGHRLSGPR